MTFHPGILTTQIIIEGLRILKSAILAINYHRGHLLSTYYLQARFKCFCICHHNEASQHPQERSTYSPHFIEGASENWRHYQICPRSDRYLIVNYEAGVE